MKYKKRDLQVKKTGILNRELSKVIASMGHGDYLVISDAGLPIPSGVEVIDVSVSENTPRFIDVLSPVLMELEVEKAILASEMKINNPKIYKSAEVLLKGIKIEEISHMDFKKKIVQAKAVVRTGEFTSYSNIILISGVVF